jgi:DNA-binding transcriptional ArsR family regulator
MVKQEHQSRPADGLGDARYARALSHPLRVRILAVLEERTASPLELSRLLEADIGVVAYHVRTLHKLGLIELERETKVRGATQRHYRAVESRSVSIEEWEDTAPVAKQAMIEAALLQIYEFARRSNAVGGFDRGDAHVTRSALRLDERGWERLRDAMAGVATEVEAIERDLRERQEAGEEIQLEDVGFAMMLFEALPFSRAQRKPDHSP